MAEVISKSGQELTVAVTVRLTGSLLEMEAAIQEATNAVGCCITEEALQRFVLRSAEGEQGPDPEFMERWIKSLPETSTDLFRRIFLRDAQRQKRQPR